MGKGRCSPQAEADLQEIWLTIARDNLMAADGILRRIAAKLDHLGQFPEMGVPRPEIAASARMLVEGNYLILYEVTAEGVEVVRVLHGAPGMTDLF